MCSLAEGLVFAWLVLQLRAWFWAHYQCSPSSGPNLVMGQNNSEVNPMRTSPHKKNPTGQQAVVRKPPEGGQEQSLRGPHSTATRTLIGTYFCHPVEVVASDLLRFYFGP